MSRFKEFSNFHNHPLSFDSASTPEDFVAKEVELGTGSITATDHGSMAANSEIYDLAKKNKIIPILGIEAYLRDDDCPILTKHGIEKEKGGFSHYAKYCHFCMHAMDERAHSEMSIRLSDAFTHRGERHGSEIKPIWTWDDVEHLGQFNVTVSSGCLIGVTAKHLMNGYPEIAEDYYQKMRSVVKPGHFMVEIFPHDCSLYYEQGVHLGFLDGSKTKVSLTKKLRIKSDGKEQEMSAESFAASLKRLASPELLAIKHYHKWNDVEPKVVVSATAVDGFSVNDCQEWAGGSDYQLGANKFMMKMAAKYGDKIVVSNDSHFVDKEQHQIQTMKLTANGGGWRFPTSYHRQTSEEAFAFLSHTLGISERTFEQWVDNSYEFRDKFKDFKFTDKIQLPVSRYPQDTVAHLKTLIEKHGRMKWGDPIWVSRLKQEIKLFRDNGTVDLLPYFFLSEEMVSAYNSKRQLSGPGRGSAAGSCLSYLLGITHIDPIETNLSLDRFITLDRIASGKLPDIDMDFGDPDFFKDPITGWVFTEFGEKAAAIATKTTLRLKSTIKDAMRSKYGSVPGYVEKLCGTLPAPPQGVTDEDFLWGYKSEDEKEIKGLWDQSTELRQFAEHEPEVWNIVTKSMGLQRGASRHASAILISEVPIKTFIPTQVISGVPTTQYTMGGVEARGGLKMDILGLNTLTDIEDCIEMIQARNGGTIVDSQILNGIKVPAHHCVPFGSKIESVWKLPPKLEVFEDICRGDTETVFQLSTASAIKWLKEFKFPKEDGSPAIDSKEGISTFTALDRPGPLDAFVEDEDGKQHNMLQEYARRARGQEATGEIKALSGMLKESIGVLTFQEQLQYVYQELTGCDGVKATEFRTNIAKKKMDKVEAAYPDFMAKAGLKVGKEEAQKIWEQLVTFGRYGFCLSEHTQVVTKNGNKSLGSVGADDLVAYFDPGTGDVCFEHPTAILHQGEKEVYEITFEDGSVLVATEDHKFLYDGEWVELSQSILRKDMEFLTNETDSKKKPNPV